MREARRALSALLLVSLAGCASAETEAPAAGGAPFLGRAHSHNDYERARPLVDAVERGFASVEVDVHLVDGVLHVAHDPRDVRASATLVGLYLDPLRELVRRNGGGVYGPQGPALQLLVDVKTEARATYGALDEVLASYEDVFTRWVRGEPVGGAVTAVLSGNRALDLVVADSVRYVAIDGRITDPERGRLSPSAMPLISMNWEDLGSDPRRRLEAARSVIDAVHREGRRVRFWGTTDSEEVWRELVRLGADYLGTDDPRRLDRFLRRGPDAPATSNDP